MLKRLSGMATAVTVIAGLLLVISPSFASAADDGPFDIWGLTGTGYTVSTGSCRDVPITARHNADSSRYAIEEVVVDVWLGNASVDDVWLNDMGNGTLSGRYRYCPGSDGLGRFRLGDSEVRYEELSEDDYLYGKFIDTSRGSFTVKQASRFRNVTAKRKKNVVAVSARPQYFASGFTTAWTPAVQANQKKADRKKKIFTLQRRSVNGKGAWRSVKSARAPESKTLTIKVRARKRFQYRIVMRESANTFGSTSRIVRR